MTRRPPGYWTNRQGTGLLDLIVACIQVFAIAFTITWITLTILGAIT